MPPSVPAPRPTVSAASSAPRKRVALYDNLKGILIVLVVFGHMMHPVHNTNQALSTCFDLIYLFHMPLFVFLSGLFAKGAYRGGKLNVNRLTLSQLRRHPYIGFYQAKTIIDHRRLHGPLRSLDDLRLYKDFPPETIERLRHYIEF